MELAKINDILPTYNASFSLKRQGVVMATDVKLTGNDPISDQLLSHASHHVVSRARKQFATGPLGLSDNQYDNIEEDAQYAERRNYEVNQNFTFQSIHILAF